MVAARQIVARFVLPSLLLFLLLGGCRSVPLQPPMDLAGPGWVVREGQAVWKPSRAAAGVAGELLVAANEDGRQVVRFTKNPLPFVDAQRTTNAWQLRIAATQQTYAGRGAPPARVTWLQLPEALAGRRLADGWKFVRGAGAHWTLENTRTGESLAGFLEGPAARSLP